MANNTLKSLGLNSWLIEQCDAIGIKKPTPIQTNCIPPILKGSDVIGCAKTGSGKTAAFALPILQKLCEDPYGIFALIITPTRELAFQIGEQFSVLGKPLSVKVSTITGGRDMVQQGIELSEKPHIVITTPGRLSDHIDTGTNFSLNKIKFLVLDEADRLLEDNFGEQLRTIFQFLPQTRQTLLFSATMTEMIRELESVALNKPFFWNGVAEVATVDTLDQRYLLMPADVKDAHLMHVLDRYQDDNPNSLVIIFTNTCKYCQILGMVCRELGFNTATLHSVMPQRLRLASLAKFKSHQVKILIATDVASRGLDIPAVDLIINHNVPNRPKDYVHRVGRTARAGRGGMAVTLVTQFDIQLVHSIEEHIKLKLSEYKVNETEVNKILTEVAVARREAEIKMDEQDFGKKKEINKRKKQILAGEINTEETKHKKTKQSQKVDSRASQKRSKHFDRNRKKRKMTE